VVRALVGRPARSVVRYVKETSTYVLTGDLPRFGMSTQLRDEELFALTKIRNIPTLLPAADVAQRSLGRVSPTFSFPPHRMGARSVRCPAASTAFAGGSHGSADELGTFACAQRQRDLPDWSAPMLFSPCSRTQPITCAARALAAGGDPRCGRPLR